MRSKAILRVTRPIIHAGALCAAVWPCFSAAVIRFVRQLVRPADFQVQSRRRAGGLTPGNTLGALVPDGKPGPVLEAGLRTTRGGVLAAIHDPNFAAAIKRATPALHTQSVKEVAFAELGRLDLGSWIRVS